jgi:hypothetical protein
MDFKNAEQETRKAIALCYGGGQPSISWPLERKGFALTKNVLYLLSYVGTMTKITYFYFLSHGGGGRIRTYVALWAADLQSAPINHSGTPPHITDKSQPERGFEPANLPITSRLRFHCATRAIFQALVNWNIIKTNEVKVKRDRVWPRILPAVHQCYKGTSQPT